MRPILHGGQPIGQTLDGLLHGFERLLGTQLRFRLRQAQVGEIALELGSLDSIRAGFLNLEE